MMDYEAVMGLTGLTVGAEPAAWEAAGFAVRDRAVQLGGVGVRLDAEARGLAGWSWSANPRGELDGLPTPSVAWGEGSGERHPNGIVSLDHVVAFSPSLDRTVGALEAAGLELRRRREGPTGRGSARQAFFWLGETILEVVEHPPSAREAGDPDAPARLWGLAVVSDDLDHTCAHAGASIGEPRDAIQPGRRIATFTREAGLGVPVAVMSPHERGQAPFGQPPRGPRQRPKGA